MKKLNNKHFNILETMGIFLKYFVRAFGILLILWVCMLPILGIYITFLFIKESYFYTDKSMDLTENESLAFDFIILLISFLPSSITIALFYLYHMY